LNKNRISKLPDSIGNLEKLEQLTLYQNQLSKLPDTFSKLKNLEKLNIGWNQFEIYPSFLSELPKLRWLATFDNPTQIDTSIFKGNKTEILTLRPFSEQKNELQF
jgi:Leucine-rich repeat (LRR) protein